MVDPNACPENPSYDAQGLSRNLSSLSEPNPFHSLEGYPNCISFTHGTKKPEK